MKSSKSPKIDKGSSQKVLMTKRNQHPLSSEFLKLQLLKESQITQEFPSHFIRSGAKHAATLPISPQISSPTPFDGTNTMFQDFKVPETPLVHQIPCTSGKPQCKIALHFVNKKCTKKTLTFQLSKGTRKRQKTKLWQRFKHHGTYPDSARNSISYIEFRRRVVIWIKCMLSDVKKCSVKKPGLSSFCLTLIPGCKDSQFYSLPFECKL